MCSFKVTTDEQKAETTRLMYQVYFCIFCKDANGGGLIDLSFVTYVRKNPKKDKKYHDFQFPY